MKKTTLILLSPLCLLYANSDRPTTDTLAQKTEKKQGVAVPWSRDAAIKARDVRAKAREKKSQELSEAVEKISNSREEDNDTLVSKYVELNDIKDKSTVLEMKPKHKDKKSAIIIEKPKSVEKPKVEGIQLEVIKKPIATDTGKDSIVVVTQVKKDASAPEVIKVVAISNKANNEQEQEEEMIVEGSAVVDDVDQNTDEAIIAEEKNPKTPYPSKFIIIKKSH